MDWFAWLRPIEWVVANIMVLFHQGLEFVGLDPESGLSWALSIVGLVITIRLALIPLFVRQIKSQRAMQMIAPDLRKIQEKYKGKKDQESREAMTRETMALYSEHKTSPFASCLPLLVQAPIFFALFRVLNYRLERGGDPIGLLTPELIEQGGRASLFGANLSATFLGSDSVEVRVFAAVLIIAMVATTFLSQRQLAFKNMPPSAMEGPMAQQQKILLYALPFIFVVSGPNFPIGVLIYWTVTNLWSMGQQFYVIRRNPTPGSEAEKALLARRAAKNARKGLAPDGRTLEEVEAEERAAREAEEEAKRNRQRQQPKRKARNKKGGKANSEPADVDGDGKPDNPEGESSSS